MISLQRMKPVVLKIMFFLGCDFVYFGMY